MLTPKKTITAFFSYAHRDWEADSARLKSMFDALQRQTRAAMGDDRFTRWRDQERLKWGDDWHETLRRVIAGADLFFLFLSPSWLNSEICREEFAAFRKREDELGGKRVFVSILRPVGKEMEAEHASLMADLRSRQYKEWRGLLDATGSARTKAIRSAGEEICTSIHALERLALETSPIELVSPISEKNAPEPSQADGVSKIVKVTPGKGVKLVSLSFAGPRALLP